MDFFPIFELFPLEKLTEIILEPKVTVFPSMVYYPLYQCSSSDLHLRALSVYFSHSSHPYHSVLSPSTVLKPSLVQSES